MTSIDCASCPVCGTDVSVPPGVESDGEICAVDCPACDLRFSHPMEHPGAAWYEDSPIYSACAESDPRADWRFRLFLDTIPGPGKLLDVGCGPGHFMAHAKKYGWEVTGLEINESAAKRARDDLGLDVRCGDALEALDRWDEEQFDAITAFDFIEHVADPLALAVRMHRMLRPGGCAFVTVPRLDRKPRVFDSTVDVPPHHLTLWTTRSLTELLGNAGFRDKAVVAKPLRARDLYQHYVWRRYGHGYPKTRRRLGDYAAFGASLLICSIGRALFRFSGHTLAGVGTRAVSDPNRR